MTLRVSAKREKVYAIVTHTLLQIRSWLLLAAIVMGGLLSPLSHLVFMSIVSGHGPGVMALEHPAPAAPAVQDCDDGAYASCPYLELYATSFAVDLEEPHRLGNQAWVAAPVSDTGQRKVVRPLGQTNPVRGPPSGIA